MKTVSLELSKQLKEAGYPQEPGFRYCGGHDYYENPDDPEGKWEDCKNDALLGEDEYCETAGMTCDYFVSSPTADEILDVLPNHINYGGGKYPIELSKHNNKYHLDYGDEMMGHYHEDVYWHPSLADACAYTYICLKKEGLI